MKAQHIAAKEHRTRNLADNARPSPRSFERLPPGQQQVYNFPVLDLGIQPSYRSFGINE